jgi:hypothetical protein
MFEVSVWEQVISRQSATKDIYIVISRNPHAYIFIRSRLSENLQAKLICRSKEIFISPL